MFFIIIIFFKYRCTSIKIWTVVQNLWHNTSTWCTQSMLKLNQIWMMQNCDRFLDLTESTRDAIYPPLKNTTVQIVCNIMIHIFTYSHIMIIVHKIVNRVRKIKQHVRQNQKQISPCIHLGSAPNHQKQQNRKTAITKWMKTSGYTLLCKASK